MREPTSPLSRSLSATVNSVSVEFIVFDEPYAEIWVDFDDVLAAAGYPIARGRQRPSAPLGADHQTIDHREDEQRLASLETARNLMMRAAELGYCPAYQTDVFEVIASYARDQLLSYDAYASDEFGEVLGAEGGE